MAFGRFAEKGARVESFFGKEADVSKSLRLGGYNFCPKAIYIGETSNSIRQYMNRHRSDIKHIRNKPVAEHFNKPDHTLKNLRLAVIKKVKDKTKQQREVEEQKIIFKFDCVSKGLNQWFLTFANLRTSRIFCKLSLNPKFLLLKFCI